MSPNTMISEPCQALRQRCEIACQMLILSHGADHPLYVQLEAAIASGSRTHMEHALAAYDGKEMLDTVMPDVERYGETD